LTEYKSPPIGNSMDWIFWNFDKDLFTNPSKLEHILRTGLKEDGLTPLDWHTHTFNDGCGNPIGYTMLVPLSESHASVHTYYEYNSIVFNLYSCLGPKSGIKTYKKCLKIIKPKHYLMTRHIIPVDNMKSNITLKINKK